MAVTAPRTNDQWLGALQSGSVDEGVVADLREFLKRGLTKAFGSRRDVSASDLDDFAQDSVMRVLGQLDSFRGDSRFTTWAMAISVNTAYAVMRKKSWGSRTFSELGLDSPESASSTGQEVADPSSNAAREDIFSAMRQAIETDLTPRQRTALFAELAGMPAQSILDELQTTPGALYKLYHDARKKLRVSLEKAGFSAKDVIEAVEGASKE
jgi:RNA polymerase sigma factor (sigma-70 family)